MNKSNNEIINYKKLLDFNISTSITTFNDFKDNTKEKSGEIEILVGDNNDNDYFIKALIDESSIYNINYKLKCAINQINDVIKNYDKV